MQFFISYSRVDRPFTERFVSRLRRMYPKHHVWYDDELLGGDIWWDEILDQIAACDIFIYLLSNESVTSPYCHAEFTEARRLQKRIITVQVRDRTKMPPELSDIQYVDMKAGVDNAEAGDRLVGAINKQVDKLPPRTLKPLWQPRTVRPSIAEEFPLQNRSDVETPTLTITSPQIKPSDTRRRWLPALVTATIAIVAILISLVPSLFATPTPTPTHTLASETPRTVAQNSTPTDVPELSSTPTPSFTASHTPDLEILARTFEAGLTQTQNALAAQQTLLANAGKTATATLWTATPTLDQTRGFIEFVTQRAAATQTQESQSLTLTATSWTPTRTPTVQPTNTPTPTPSNTTRPPAQTQTRSATAPLTSTAAYTPTPTSVGILVPSKTLSSSNIVFPDNIPILTPTVFTLSTPFPLVLANTGNVRAGPGTVFPIILTLHINSPELKSAKIIGRGPEDLSEWYLIQWIDSNQLLREGWMNKIVLRLGNNVNIISTVPHTFVPASPTPTLTPTNIPSSKCIEIWGPAIFHKGQRVTAKKQLVWAGGGSHDIVAGAKGTVISVYCDFFGDTYVWVYIAAFSSDESTFNLTQSSRWLDGWQ
jgi:hypothetical protein